MNDLFEIAGNIAQDMKTANYSKKQLHKVCMQESVRLKIPYFILHSKVQNAYLAMFIYKD